MSNQKFFSWHDAKIRRYYPEYGEEETAKHLEGFTPAQILYRAKKLGIKWATIKKKVSTIQRPTAVYSNKGYWQYGF